MISSIQSNFESKIILRYFAIKVPSINKLLQLVFFILALWKTIKKGFLKV